MIKGCRNVFAILTAPVVPTGCAAMQFPGSPRIFAVADVFDALTSERPYKKAMTLALFLASFLSATLLFSWAPVIGDALCATAGWQRPNRLAGVLRMALGKFCRYVVVVARAGY